MSLVKFTELPSGSLQGGDVLAVAGASSYKVTSVELANWINKRLQGNTDKTVEEVWNRAKGNSDYTTNVVNPQLGQIGTNKSDIALLKTDLNATNAYTIENRKKIYAMAGGQYDNQPALIAGLIKDDNFIKNPAAQNIKLYWDMQTKSAVMPGLVLSDLKQKNLEYPGWSRTGDLLTYNFTVALDGMLTIGQLGGTKAEDLEYRVNGGAWNKVGNGGILSIGVGYVASTAGAQISVRMNKDSGGIAFAIPSPAYWTTNTGVRDPNIRVALEKLTYGLRRKYIDMVACGYWFAAAGKISNGEYAVHKSYMIGTVTETVVCGYDMGKTPVHLIPHWLDPNDKLTLKVSSNMKDITYLFGASDPDLYSQAEVY